MATRFSTITSAVFFAIALAGAQPVAADEKDDAGFHDAMVAFLTTQNTADTIGGQMTYAVAQQTLATISASGAEVTQEMQDAIVDVAGATVGARFGDVDLLATLYAPVYAEYYSESELRELIAFWKSPIGKKTIGVMPELTAESSRVLEEAIVEFVPGYEAALNKRFIDSEIVSQMAPAAE